MKKILFLLLATISLALASGCTHLGAGGAAADAGTVIYVHGELKDTQQFPLGTVHAATVAGLRDLEFAVVSDAMDTTNSTIIARTAKDANTQLVLTRLSPAQTEIRIRVGPLGDEVLSRQILDKIKAHL